MDLPVKLIREMAKSQWQFSYLIADSQEGCQPIQAEQSQNVEFSEFLEEANQMVVQQTKLFTKLSQTSSDKNSESCSDENSSVESSQSKQQSRVADLIKQREDVLDFSGDQEQSLYQCKQSRKTRKIKKRTKQPYPTKNFLPVFRPFLINYIEKRCPSASQNQIIIDIKGKKCVNCQDFETLFKLEQFRPILGQYFRQKKIYRDLMQSRVSYDLKLKYFERIQVFEKAFKAKKFKKIN